MRKHDDPAGDMEPRLVFETRPIFYDPITGEFLLLPFVNDRSLRRKAVSVRYQFRLNPFSSKKWRQGYRFPRSVSVGTYYQQADGKWIVSVGPSMQTELGPFDTEDEARLNFITAFELEEMDKPFREIPFL